MRPIPLNETPAVQKYLQIELDLIKGRADNTLTIDAVDELLDRLEAHWWDLTHREREVVEWFFGEDPVPISTLTEQNLPSGRPIC